MRRARALRATALLVGIAPLACLSVEESSETAAGTLAPASCPEDSTELSGVVDGVPIQLTEDTKIFSVSQWEGGGLAVSFGRGGQLQLQWEVVVDYGASVAATGGLILPENTGFGGEPRSVGEGTRVTLELHGATFVLADIGGNGGQLSGCAR